MRVEPRVVDGPEITSPQRSQQQLSWPVGDVVGTPLPTLDNPVDNGAGRELLGDRGGHLGDVAGERMQLTRLQIHALRSAEREAPAS